MDCTAPGRSINTTVRSARGVGTLTVGGAPAAQSPKASRTTRSTSPALKEIFGEIDRLRSEAPPADEVRGIQNYLAGTFVLRSSTQAGLARQFGFVDLHGLGDDYLTSYVRHVYALTPADVQRIAQQYLDPTKMAIVVAGDKKTVADQLAPYGRVVQ